MNEYVHKLEWFQWKSASVYTVNNAVPIAIQSKTKKENKNLENCCNSICFSWMNRVQVTGPSPSPPQPRPQTGSILPILVDLGPSFGLFKLTMASLQCKQNNQICIIIMVSLWVPMVLATTHFWKFPIACTHRKQKTKAKSIKFVCSCVLSCLCNHMLASGEKLVSARYTKEKSAALVKTEIETSCRLWSEVDSFFQREYSLWTNDKTVHC